MARKEVLHGTQDFSPYVGLSSERELLVPEAGVRTLSGAGLPLPAGLGNTGRSRFSTVPVGSVAYGSLGTNTTPVSGTIYWAELFIPRNITLTGIAFLNGGTVGTDKAIAGLWDSGGTLVANSALAGTTTAGSDAFQALAFTATYDALGPNRFWVGLQFNGTTTRFRTIAVSTFIDCLTSSAVGSFGTLTALTVPTTVTADVGPIAYVY